MNKLKAKIVTGIAALATLAGFYTGRQTGYEAGKADERARVVKVYDNDSHDLLKRADLALADSGIERDIHFWKKSFTDEQYSSMRSSDLYTAFKTARYELLLAKTPEEKEKYFHQLTSIINAAERVGAAEGLLYAKFISQQPEISSKR